MKYFWKPLLWIIVIAVLSLLPADDLPSSKLFFPHFDKLVHAGMYFFSCLFFISPFQKTGFGKGYCAAFISSLFIGGLFEVLQSTLTRNRSGNIEDFVADLVGAALALVCFRYIISGTKIETIFKAQ